MKVLELKGLQKSFGDARAVDGISLAVEDGQIFGLVGRNGAGKTTTLRMIMDIYVPDAGEILFRGAKRPADFHRRVGYLPEERGLYRFMSVMDNLLFLAEIKGVPNAVARPRAQQYLERFDLAKKGRATLDSLSKGNQQKVQFIGTVLHQPELVVLDEAFSGLDPVNTNLFKDMILELREAGTVIILSTHQMDIAERLCDHVALVNKGKLVLNAATTAIKREYSQSMVSLQAEGDLSFVRSLPYVSSLQQFGNAASVQVKSDGDIQELLRALVARHIVVKKFQANEMSMHDIFVSLTQTPEETLAGFAAAKKRELEEVAA